MAGRDDPQLYVRQGDRVAPAPAADVAVAAGYGGWPDKGPEVDGRRLTIMAADRAYRVGDTVRVIHILEVAAGGSLYVAGPKIVTDEYLDGRPAGPRQPAGADPLDPLSYDGPVLPGPGTDFNWEITEYELREPGTTRIVWRPGGLMSNTLTVPVAPA